MSALPACAACPPRMETADCKPDLAASVGSGHLLSFAQLLLGVDLTSLKVVLLSFITEHNEVSCPRIVYPWSRQAVGNPGSG